MTTSPTHPSVNEQDLLTTLKSIYSAHSFSGKTVLVTGAARGIGRAIAEAFGALGASVAVNYAGSEEDARKVTQNIIEHGSKAMCLQFNVSDSAAVNVAIKNIERELGSIDILVNNAGIAKDNLLVRYKDEEWNNTLDTNLKGAFICSRAVALSMMKKRQGNIINISSVIGLTGNAGQTAYAASKAGLIGLTKSLALELASRNIRVNAVAPGFIQTRMTDALADEAMKKIVERIPAGRTGNPIDVAKAVIFLASSAADYITGQTLTVDGGLVMH